MHLLQARSSLIFRQTIECGFTPQLVCDMIITYSQLHHTNKYSQHSSIIWPVWLNGRVFIYKLSGYGFESHYCHLPSDMAPALSKEFLDIQASYSMWILQQCYQKNSEEMLDIYFLCLLSILLSMQGSTLLYTKFNR